MKLREEARPRTTCDTTQTEHAKVADRIQNIFLITIEKEGKKQTYQ